MTQEQKAKAYDEAIERARTIVENQNASSVWKDWLCNTFPELKESEDEKVRKEIMSYIKSSGAITNKQWIAWLEKQGQQKPADKIQLGKKYKCIASPIYSAFITGEIYKPEDKFLCSLMNFCYDCFEPIEDGEQKSANKVELKIENSPLLSDFFNAEYERGKADALKSVEWSEEDEKNLAQCIEAIDACYKWDSMIDWLKSLRSRSRWKPSDEQMEALDSVIDEYDGYPEFDSLASLKKDLEKLKEE